MDLCEDDKFFLSLFLTKTMIASTVILWLIYAILVVEYSILFTILVYLFRLN